MLTFAIGFALAAFGGVVAAPITTVDFRGGVDILPVCFMAVIIGGLGNLPGTAAAAVLLAFMEGVIQSFADPTVARIASLVLDERGAPDAAAGPLQGIRAMSRAAVDRTLFAAFAVLMLAVPWIVPQLLGSFWVSVIAEILIWSLLAASVNLLFGYVGLLSFGQALYFGFGMYGVGIGIAHLGPFVLAGVRPGHRVLGGDGAGLGHLRGAAHVALLRHHHRRVLAHLLFPFPHHQAGDRRRRRHQFLAAADLQVRRDRDQPRRQHLPVLLHPVLRGAVLLADAPGDRAARSARR